MSLPHPTVLPAPRSPHRYDRAAAAWRVAVEERSVASWQTARAAACVRLAEANRRAAALARAGWDACAMRRQHVGAALRELNRVRRGLAAARRRHAAAEAALSALSRPVLLSPAA